MVNNSKDNNHTRHISIRDNVVSIGEKCKIHRFKWCEGGLKLSYIATNNVN